MSQSAAWCPAARARFGPGQGGQRLPIDPATATIQAAADNRAVREPGGPRLRGVSPSQSLESLETPESLDRSPWTDMGRQDVQDRTDGEELRLFSRALLRDLRAFEHMLDRGLFETKIRRIGAEQEMFLVDHEFRPAFNGVEVLELVDDPHFTTELARFNLECNLDPITLGNSALRRLETQLAELLNKVRTAARQLDTDIVLSGILPTLEMSDLTLENMTPRARYYALNDAMNRMRGERYRLHIKGRHELNLTHDNVMLEACNTSFQVHFQVKPETFARIYNIAQAVAAPVLAAAVNSPLLFGRQLWRETRIALFQQSVDTRSPAGHMRQLPSRVSFGRRWVHESVAEIFKEDISRFRVLLSTDVEQDPFEVLDQGKAPRLAALCLHNGTIYRWNRPCYGVSSNGTAHLRIENRVLPSGPSPLDEIANAALWFGLLKGVEDLYGDITQVMDFDQARENFLLASRRGLTAHLNWPEHEDVSAQNLLLEELLPLARDGLNGLEIDSSDIDRYLGIVEERVRSLRTGAQWMVDSYSAMKTKGNRAESLSALVAATLSRQKGGKPVHTWDPAALWEAGESRRYYSRVGQLMTTDLFTVNRDDLVDVVACVMNWHHIRHVPVEDEDHKIVGLVTHRSLLRLLAEASVGEGQKPVPVSAIMHTNVITVHPETPTLEAIRTMKDHKISCLPVVDQRQRLVGIVSERDFMAIADHLVEAYLS